jgi:hypothetical protein
MNEAKANALVADLMGMAYGQAHGVLVQRSAEHKQLVPTFLVMTGAKVEIFACPWQSDQEKYMAQDLIRARMKAQKSQAYSFLSEAWMLVVDQADFEAQKRAESGVLRPSQSERRIEVVTIVACAKHESGMARAFQMWNIIRDDQGTITALEKHILPGDGPESVGGEFPTMLDD